MQKTYIKLCSIFLALILLIPCVLVPANAGIFDSVTGPTANNSNQKNISEHFFASEYLESLYPGLKEHLRSNIQECASVIDISQFAVAYDEGVWNAITSMIYNEMFDLFHVGNIGYSATSTANSQVFNTITVNYTNYSKETYTQQLTEIENASNEILFGITGNNALSDVEKALLIHDRLAIKCRYAESNEILLPSAHNIHGPLALGYSVCQGYTEAYSYLLDKVGIKNFINISTELNHAWNVVYIDGKPYHVDVTWDDPVNDVIGRVIHDNFLISDAKFLENGHVLENGQLATDYYIGATHTDYDTAFWGNSTTEFQLLNNKIYYIDNVSQKLICYSDNAILTDVSDIWFAGNYQFWSENYSRLSSDNSNLFYSLSKAVYKYDLTTNTTEKVFEPDLSAYNYYNIFGIKVDGTTLQCKASYMPYSVDSESVYLYSEISTKTLPTLKEENGVWYYYSNGELDFSETLVEFNGSWYYVNNGILDWNYTGLCAYNGNFYHVTNGVLDWGYSGLSYYCGEYYYVTNGVLDWSYTGLTEYYGIWYYVSGGYLNWGVTTLTEFCGTWYYVENGVLNWNYTGLCEYYGGYYHIANGVLDWGYSGLSYYCGEFYYVTNGVLDWNYTGLTEYYGTWYYVVNGYLDWSVVTLTEYCGVWYYIENGAINWNSNTLVCYNGDWYYTVGGTVAWDYTGYVEYCGCNYYITNGYLDWSKQ